MTDPLAPTPTPSPSLSAATDDRQIALIVYILYLVPVGITHVIGVILAYVSRETAPAWLKTHYTFQIRTFWIGLLYAVISCCLIIVVIGIPMLAAVFFWFVIRCALGLSRLTRGEAYPTPASWMF